MGPHLKGMLRFALLITNAPDLSLREIHKSDCPNVAKMIRRGAFAQILSTSSAESIRETELAIIADGRTHADFVISVVVQDRNETPLPTVNRHGMTGEC